MDEGRLVTLLKQGNEEAYRILVRRYQKKLFGIAFGMVQDKEASLEIVQEVFLKVFRKIKTFREEAGLYTWLHRITINQCLSRRRRWARRFRRRHQPFETEDSADRLELASPESGPEILYMEKELDAAIVKSLKNLPAQARAVFVMKELEGLSYDEIAGLLNIKKGTVSSRLFYARRALRESLSASRDEDNGQ